MSMLFIPIHRGSKKSKKDFKIFPIPCFLRDMERKSKIAQAVFSFGRMV